MHQGYRRSTQVTFREVATVEFQPGESSGPKPPVDFIEVTLVDVHSNNPFCSFTVDLLQAVAARYSKHRDAPRNTIIERAFKQLSQSRQLLHTWGTHVPFIIFQRYGEPR